MTPEEFSKELKKQYNSDPLPLTIVTWAIIPVAVVGMVCGVFNILTRLQHFMKSSINLLLLGLALSDLGIVLAGTLSHVPGGLVMYHLVTTANYSVTPALTAFISYNMKISHSIYRVCSTISVYVLILVTIERYFAVCYPLKARVYCTMKNARIGLCLVYIGSACFNFPCFLEIGVYWADNESVYKAENIGKEIFGLGYDRIYSQWLYFIVMFTVPFSAMLILNSATIKALRRSRKDRRRMSHGQLQTYSITSMLLFVVLIFLLCQTLPFALRIYSISFHERARFLNQNDTQLQYYNHMLSYNFSAIDFLLMLSCFMTILQASLNFPIYYKYSALFREGFWAVLNGGRRKNETVSALVSIHQNSSFPMTTRLMSSESSTQELRNHSSNPCLKAASVHLPMEKEMLCLKFSSPTRTEVEFFQDTPI